MLPNRCADPANGEGPHFDPLDVPNNKLIDLRQPAVPLQGVHQRGVLAVKPAVRERVPPSRGTPHASDQGLNLPQIEHRHALGCEPGHETLQDFLDQVKLLNVAG